jgi:hypothetical protein
MEIILEKAQAILSAPSKVGFGESNTRLAKRAAFASISSRC